MKGVVGGLTALCWFTAAHAEVTDRQIADALREATQLHGGNPNIKGFAMEVLVRDVTSVLMSRPCVLAAPGDLKHDVICPSGGRGRPVSIQVKAGQSASAIARVCLAIESGRYSGVRMMLASDTYASAMARCSAAILARGPMIASFPVSTAEISMVGLRMAQTAALIRLIPWVGAVAGTGVVAWETYDIVMDDTLGTVEKAEKITGSLAETAVEVVAAGGVAAAIVAIVGGSAAVWVPTVGAIAVGGSVVYAIRESGVGDFVHATAARATGWIIRQ